ncbi:MAG TPA: hypothetical protein EYP98_11095, partial [Planctomycetes bacterium]|nr:hypothetical protein [Planctomycetota bacterium]
EMYARYLDNPNSVDSSWFSFFTDMDDDARDVLRLGQPHVLKRLAAINGLVDTRAGHRTAQDVGFTGAHPDRLGVRGRNRDVTDAGGRIALEDRLPVTAIVDGLPHPTRRSRQEDGVWLVLMGSDIRCSPGHTHRPNRLPGVLAV